MRMTLCLLAAFAAMSAAGATQASPSPTGNGASMPLLLCPIGQRAKPIYDSEGKVVSWVCVKK